MKTLNFFPVSLFAACLALSGCGSKSESAATAPSSTAAPVAATAPATTAPAADPAAANVAPGAVAPAPAPAPAPVAAAPPPPAPPAAPPPPPKPVTHTYVLAAGTPITVRTVEQVSTKVVKNGNEFQAVLESPLVGDGHTFAKTGATVVGTVVNADQGGRVKGKSSLTLALARIQMNGKMTTVQSSTVVQEGKGDTKKNLVRTGLLAGAGAAVGAIAGGGQGAAIGAGIGGGAGVATNLATRGPAADVPAETVLNFTLRNEISVTITEKAPKQ